MGFGHGDVAFAEAIVEAVADKVEIDLRRVYANGISNGAQMSWRLACNASDLFAAFGLVAGGYTEICGKGDRPPVILFHGTADRLLPYDGRSFFMPVRDFARGWAARAGCKPAEQGEVIYRRGDATGELWRCEEGGEVVLYTLEGKGHSWPGSAMPARITSRDVDATAVMWEFFQRYRLP
jgi:polyhydroxybutyrate depolymerase